MSHLLANSIWAPIFVYCYDWRFVLVSTLAGFAAELWVFQQYMRGIVAREMSRGRLIKANLISWLAGFLLINFYPFGVPMTDLISTAGAFLFGYVITVAVEFSILRTISPQNLRQLVRAVVMCNFISYSILFTSYFIWFIGWTYLMHRLGLR